MTSSISIRILRDSKSKDGWIAKDSQGQICFLANLDQIIAQLEPGQLWQALVIETAEKFKIVQADYLLKP
jgi:hypothetical protein